MLTIGAREHQTITKRGDGQIVCKYVPLGLSLCPQCSLSALPTAYC